MLKVSWTKNLVSSITSLAISFQTSKFIQLLLHHIKLSGCFQVGDESYESYSMEKDGILLSLARRAKVS